jgi:hypothetical protein
MAAAGYAIVDESSKGTLGMNVPITGNVLLGQNVTANFAGGASISGTLFYDSTVKGTSTFSQIKPTPTETKGSTSLTSTVAADAAEVSNYAASLTATKTFATNITSATTLTGDGGLNVIDVKSIQNAALTFKGTAKDIFIVNVSGTYQTNKSMTLQGVTAAQILFNFTGTSGNVLSTSGGDCTTNGKANGNTCLDGTFLATDGGGFQFSHLQIDGELIDTDGNIQLVSNSIITANAPFTPTPLPAALPLFATGLGGLGLLGWRRKRKAQASA